MVKKFPTLWGALGVQGQSQPHDAGLPRTSRL